MRWWHRSLRMPSAARGRLLVIPAVLLGFVPHALAVTLYLIYAPAGVWEGAIPWTRVILKGVLSAGALGSLILVWVYSRPARGVISVYDWLGGGLLSLAFVWLGSLAQDLVRNGMLDPLGRLLIPFGTALWGGVGIGLTIAGTAHLSRELHSERLERQRLEALMTFTQLITGRDYQSVLDAAVQHLQRLLQADSGVLYLWSEQEQVLSPVANVHDMRQYTPEYVSKMMAFKCPLGFGLTGWVMQTGDAHITGDVMRDPHSQAVPGWTHQEKSSILVPMQVEGRRLGVVRLTRTGLNQFTTDDMKLVQSFADQAALVLEHTRALKELSEMSMTDAMTGLYNSRHFYQVLDVEVKRAHRYDQALSLIMTDSDSLKQVNDQFGHQQGDEHVRVIAQVLKSATRLTDHAFRYAGDEFVVILTNTESEEARVVAERIRKNMETSTMKDSIFGTLSVGVATLGVHAQDGRGLLAAADAAMSESKRAGKNQVTMATPR